jgi:hypothetical protein
MKTVTLLLLLAPTTPAAICRTENFLVEAPTPEIASKVAQEAERYRREQARLWLDHDLPPWRQPCKIKVTITTTGSGGATTFMFDNGRLLEQEMALEGTLENILTGVLPHEVTHTIWAWHFRKPVPRWADEGAAILAENEPEQQRHVQACRRILRTSGRALSLRRVLDTKSYPSDPMPFYVEAHSLTRFLVDLKGHSVLVAFVEAGLADGWDKAVRTVYGYADVDDLERAWLEATRSTERRWFLPRLRISKDDGPPDVPNTLPPPPDPPTVRLQPPRTGPDPLRIVDPDIRVRPQAILPPPR